MGAPPTLVPPGTSAAAHGLDLETATRPAGPHRVQHGEEQRAPGAAAATASAETPSAGWSRSMRREASSDLRSDMQPTTLDRRRVALQLPPGRVTASESSTGSAPLEWTMQPSARPPAACRRRRGSAGGRAARREAAGRTRRTSRARGARAGGARESGTSPPCGGAALPFLTQKRLELFVDQVVLSLSAARPWASPGHAVRSIPSGSLFDDPPAKRSAVRPRRPSLDHASTGTTSRVSIRSECEIKVTRLCRVKR